MNSSDIYGLRRNGEAHGDVFTSMIVVRHMLDMVGYAGSCDLSSIRILEPSCGDGSFLLEILHRLKSSSKLFGFDFAEVARHNVLACEIDHDKVVSLRRRLTEAGIGQDVADNVVRECDFLAEELPHFDLVVGNPPYVRYEQLSAQTIEKLRRGFPTFHYRSDLYVPFYEKSLKLLDDGGKHCFICSNRWLKNEYGRKLRQMVASGYNLDTVIDMEAVNPFASNVMAYTDIVLIRKQRMGLTFDFAKLSSLGELDNINAIRSQRKSPTTDDWTACFVESEDYSSFPTISQQGFKIGIGVATGADRIFISTSLNEMVEQQLLIPIISSRDLRGNKMEWKGTFLLNPYNSDGTLVDLERYPRAKAYLELHANKLKSRHIALKKPTRWYGTIDRINPHLMKQPKILLPDMTANKQIFVDEGKYYPSHNLYYITGGDVKSLKILSAMLMSSFVAVQLQQITSCMNGGYVRWQSQYIHKLRLPEVSAINNEQREKLLEAYAKSDTKGVDAVMEDIVSCNRLSNKASKRRQYASHRQLELFQRP